MGYSLMRWMCLCAVLVFPMWSAAGCGGDEQGTGGAAGSGGSSGTGGSAGTGGSSGTGGSAGSGGGSAPELTLEQQVVGAWAQSGSCGDTDIVVAKFICPGGRVRGGISFNNFDFVVCGTWSAVEPDDVAVNAQLIAVQDPSDPANQEVEALSYTYDSDADQLIYHASCEIPLERAEGGVTADDCETSVSQCTSGGGSGPVQCVEDCDCGRCNYCESGTCRYGGEGPYGCYRGCGEYVP